MDVAAFDVSKRELVFSHRGRGGKLANEDLAIGAFLKGLPLGSTVAMEATGRYHLPLANIAFNRGFRVVVANPRRVSAFTRSTRARGKCDRTDAAAIALYVESQKDSLRNYNPAPETALRVRALTRERQVIVDAKASLSQSLIASPEVARAASKGLDQAINALETELLKILSDIGEYRLLLGIPGVGPVVAAGMMGLLMSFDFATADSFVAYLGMDPRPNDSGSRAGKRYVSGQGDALVRRLAFLAGMAGKRTTAWKDYAQKQTDKGLSGTETALIVGRKIARAAWSIYKKKQPFSQQRISSRLDMKP